MLLNLWLRLFAKYHPIQDRHVRDLIKYGRLKERRGQYAKIKTKRREFYREIFNDEYEVQVRSAPYYWIKVEGAGIGSIKGHRYIPSKETQARLVELISSRRK